MIGLPMIGLGTGHLGLSRRYQNGSARQCVDERVSTIAPQFCCERTGTACHWRVLLFHTRTSVQA
ncbi:MAG: hypothetical protein KA173_09650, partial [Rhodoferax sp.]|nr:hypothetical protein [Rhodoferax sp.]